MGKAPWKTIGAVLLTLWIVPQLTRQVQDRAAVRDLKVDLAADIDTALKELENVGIFRAYDRVQKNDVGALQFSENGLVVVAKNAPKIPERKAFNLAFTEWVKRRSQISTKLIFYYERDSELISTWDAFGTVVLHWYFLTEDPSDPAFVEPLRKGISVFNDSVADWEEPVFLSLSESDATNLKTGPVSRLGINDFYNSFSDFSDQLDDAEGMIIRRLGDGHVSGFSTRPCDLVSTLFNQEPGKFCRK